MKKFYNVHSIWLVLILLTISTYALGYFNASGITIMLVLVITAFVKGGMIIRDFMELRGVSLLWRIIMYGWLIIVCLSIIIAHLISSL